MQDFFEGPRLGDRLEEVIKETRAWGRVTAKSLRMRIASLTLSERMQLEQSIKSRVRAPKLEIERVSFSFSRHGIFLEHGVGRGRPVGSSQANANKKVWIKPELEAGLEQLAELLSQEYADVAAGELKLTVPGVIQTKIKLNG